MERQTFDFSVNGGGSFYTLTPNTDDAEEWADQNIGDDETQYLGRGIVVECRYIEPLCEGILEAGFSVERDGNAMYIKDGELLLQAA